MSTPPFTHVHRWMGQSGQSQTLSEFKETTLAPESKLRHGLTRDDVRLSNNNGRSSKEKTNPRALLIYTVYTVYINVFRHVEVNKCR